MPRDFTDFIKTDPIKFKFDLFKRVFNYTPHASQAAVHRSTKRFTTVAAPARSGKSWCAAMEAVFAACDPTGGRIWVVGPLYSMAEKVFREIWRIILEEPKTKGFFQVVKKSERDMYIKIKWRDGVFSEIYGKSTTNEESLLGEGVNYMIVDEASRIAERIWTGYLLTRMTNTEGRVLAISTPNGKGNFFHKMYLMGLSSAPEDSEYASYRMRVTDNPANSEKAIKDLERIRDIDPIRYAQEVEGKFVSAEGEVFPTFDSDVFFGNVKRQPGIEVEATIDFGFTNATSCLFLQRMDKRFVRVFEEYYKSGLTDMENAFALRKVFKKYGVRRCVVDPQCPNSYNTYRKLIPDVTFVLGINDRETGLNVLRDHFNHDKETGKPYIMFDKSCTNTLAEFEKAHYPKNRTGSLNELPVDKDNHSIAALRYFLMKYCNFLNRVDMSVASAFGEERILHKLMADQPREITDPVSFDVESERRDWMGDFAWPE